MKTFLAFALLTLVSCNNSSRQELEKRLPEPGRQELLQIYWVLGAGAKDSLWKAPAKELLEQGLGARFERHIVQNEAEGLEYLKALSARPFDLLVLDGGLAQRLWAKDPRPLLKAKVLYLGASGAAEHIGLSVDGQSLKDFWSKLGKSSLKAQSCTLTEGPKSCVRIAIDWVALLRHVLSANKVWTGESIELNFHGPYLAPQLNTELMGPKEIEAFTKYLKTWALGELAH